MDPALNDAPPFDPIRHRRGGRPRKTVDGLHEIIPARFTHDEAARIRAAAAQAGVSSSAIVRAAFNNAELRLIVMRTAAPEVVQQLRYMGNNVRQTLFEARRGTFGPEVEAEARQALQVIYSELGPLLHGSER